MTTGDVTKEIEGNAPSEVVDTLVIAGGGIKGLALGPIVRTLENEGILQNINTVIGSSVGGLTAAMLALGLNAQELENYLKTGGKGLMDMFSTPDIYASEIITKITTAAVNVKDSIGVAKGSTLYHASQAAVGDALGNPHATFADLEKLAGTESQSGGKFRNLELTVTVTDDLGRGSYQIVCSAKTMPNMPIALAMRMTAGLPPIFPPVKLTASDIKKFTKGATEPLVKYHRETPVIYKADETAHIPLVVVDPILSEQQYPPFPSFSSRTFYSASADEKQKIIDDINNDLLKHSLNENGELICRDGGVVENVPIYLAVNRPGGNLDKTMAFDFEVPSRKKIRTENKKLYAEDKLIDQKAENYYSNVILNPVMNDKMYSAVQFLLTCRIPQQYRLALLQKNNLIVSETGDITAGDFELEPTKTQTHDQKVTYLRYHGYEACREYLASKGKTPQESFFEMYPDEREKAEKELKAYEDKKKAEPNSIFKRALSFFAGTAPVQEQIEKVGSSLECWQKILESIMTKTYGEKHNVQVFLYKNIMEMREMLEKVKGLEGDRQASESLLDILLRCAQFTEQNLQLIIDAKKEADKDFTELSQLLDSCEKKNYANMEKSQETINELAKTDRGLAKVYARLHKLQESSKFFEELLRLIRDESIVPLKRDRRPEVVAEYYKEHPGGAKKVDLPTKSSPPLDRPSSPTKSPAGPESSSSESKKPKL